MIARNGFRSVLLAATLASATVMAVAPVAAQDIRDPYEETNREIFQFNLGLDRGLIRPVSRGYRTVAPKPFRDGLSNALENLTEPQTLFNNILQGDAEAGWNTFVRFMINTTVGLGGLFDITTAGNFERRKEDFGQTLAVWGTDSGSYIMLPLFGPSSVRDTAGKVVDIVTDPFGLVFGFVPALSRTGAGIIDNRSETIEASESLEATSIDLYASIRTLHFQNREYQIRNGAPAPLDDLYRDLELQKDVAVRFPRAQSN
ncbi:MAG: VacJ family lipoprotein [Minwuia sp.]|nr:VacJ family lipoprotein [Minwuia sp.]